MKKLLLIALALLFLAGPCFAAGSAISVTNDSILGKTVRVVDVSFTADDADGSIPSLTLNDSTSGVLGVTESFYGWCGYKIFIDGNHTGTEPTEDSEIYIYEGGLDLLDGNGVNQVDNTDERSTYFQNDGQPMPQPFLDTWTVTITQQAAATNSATGTVKIVFLPCQ